jgi:hypothetical protein
MLLILLLLFRRLRGRRRLLPLLGLGRDGGGAGLMVACFGFASGGRC